MKISSDKYYAKVQELLQNVSEEDVVQWNNSLITKALRLTLEGDVLAKSEEWRTGKFTAESAEGTVQLNSQALGEAMSLESVLEWMNTLKDYLEVESD